MYLHKPVQWEPIEKDVRKKFDNAEQSKDHPV